MWLMDFRAFMSLILQALLHKGWFLLFWHEKASLGREYIVWHGWSRVPYMLTAHKGKCFSLGLRVSWRKVLIEAYRLLTFPEQLFPADCALWQLGRQNMFYNDNGFLPRKTRPLASITFQYVLCIWRIKFTLTLRAEILGVRGEVAHTSINI